MPSPPHRPATLSPFNRPSSASSSSLPPPLPSPSLSPSINSLLNSRTTQEYFPPSFGVGPGDAARAAAAFFSEEAAEPEPQPLQQKQQQVTREASRPLSANADPGTVFSSSSSSSNGRERSSTPSQHHHNNNPGASSSSSSSSAQQHLSAAEPPRKRSRPPSSEQETDMMPPPPSRVASGSPKRVATAPLAPPPPPARDPNAIEPSIFNVEPIDEFTKEVADWLWGFCSGLDPEVVEVHFKIGARSRGEQGLMRDVSSSRLRPRLESCWIQDQEGGKGIICRFRLRRVSLREAAKASLTDLVVCATVLTDDTGLRFESNMTIVRLSLASVLPCPPNPFALAEPTQSLQLTPQLPRRIHRITLPHLPPRPLRPHTRVRLLSSSFFRRSF